MGTACSQALKRCASRSNKLFLCRSQEQDLETAWYSGQLQLYRADAANDNPSFSCPSFNISIGGDRNRNSQSCYLAIIQSNNTSWARVIKQLPGIAGDRASSYYLARPMSALQWTWRARMGSRLTCRHCRVSQMAIAGDPRGALIGLHVGWMFTSHVSGGPGD